MQIGEFSKICNTKISVLRHYDKAGLLQPVYTDPFTGYRYYGKEQIAEYLKIATLKKAGFTLPEIKKIFDERRNSDAILEMFRKKKAELEETLLHLDTAEKTIVGVEHIMKITVIDIGGKEKVRAFKTQAEEWPRVFEEIDKAIQSEGYQRTSPYEIQGAEQAVCSVVKLTNEEQIPHEDINLSFVNDDTVIGKWEILGEYAVREDFDPKHICLTQDDNSRILYFLPDGERYWCYGWTKGKLLIDDGYATTVNTYSTEVMDGYYYMFVDLKSYHYRHGGETTTLVLRRLNNKAYKEEDIRRKDNIELPFIPDENVLGSWRAVAFCERKEDFDPTLCDEENKLYFSKVEFHPNGRVVSFYEHGTEVIDSIDLQTWTKGYLLRKWNQTACAYEIREIDGEEYLFIEWKSGDYRWGGYETDYYVFVRK